MTKSKLGKWSEDNHNYREVILNGHKIGEVAPWEIWSDYFRQCECSGGRFYGGDHKLRHQANRLESEVLRHIKAEIDFYKSEYEKLTGKKYDDQEQ